MRQRDAWIAGAAIAALLFWPRRAAASIKPGIDVRFPEPWNAWPAPEGWTPSLDYFDPVYGEAADAELADEGLDSFDPFELLGVGLPDLYQGASMETADDPQVAALLYAIRCSEHNAADVASGDDYRTFYGGDKFTDLSDHPVTTGEMRGVKLPDAMCKAAGFGPGCVSTAAGAYQITRPTWNEFRALSPRLPDFSPRSQDIAAARILQRLGVPRLLYAGDVHGAIMAASKRWASLPGSTAKQGGRSMAFVLDKFSKAGGTYA